MTNSMDPEAPYYLPVVQMGTEISFIKDVNRSKSWDEFRAEQQARFEDENSLLATTMHYMGRLTTIRSHLVDLAHVSHLMTYGLLAHQAEIDARAAGRPAETGKLPVVESAAINSFDAGVQDDSEWNELHESAFRRLTMRNRRLPDFIAGFMKSSGVVLPEAVGTVRNGMVLTHAFLDLQATADVATGPKPQSERG